MNKGNKINFTSLGCPRNLVDSEVMLGILMKSGYEVTPYLEEADYLIVNTCGFLKASRDESNDVIEELLDSRKKGAKVIVTGCMAQTHQEEIRKNYPEIDSILGSGDVESILKAIQKKEKTEMLQSIIRVWYLMISAIFLLAILLIWIVYCFFGLLIPFLKDLWSLLKDGIFRIRR